jgi:hypothetical protein
MTYSHSNVVQPTTCFFTSARAERELGYTDWSFCLPALSVTDRMIATKY